METLLSALKRPAALFLLPLSLACLAQCSQDPGSQQEDLLRSEDTVVVFPGQDVVLGNDLFSLPDHGEEDGCDASKWYIDEDGDGVGTKSETVSSCFPVEGYVAIAGDCNDGDGTMFPGNDEICDKRDNDCNGKVDDGLDCESCQAGETQPCGMWDTGECAYGTAECVNGKWGPCSGELGPSPEVCDGLDNDCDGKIDDGIDCSCEEGETESCGESEIGECKLGTMHCVDGVWGDCEGLVEPTIELCDELDNDCDGDVDEACVCPEGETEPCGINTGLCAAGLRTCSDGEWTDCEGAIDPVDETCDGQDNDCDGETDEGCDCLSGDTEPCGINTGECQAGTRTCSEGAWGPCDGEIASVEESCDGKDNDCDGQIDEVCDCLMGDTEPCGKNLGECKTGTKTCVNGVWGGCQGAIGPVDEVCDGKDNDCDGETDEVCECGPGDTKPCGDSTGECEEGTQPCVNGSWGACTGGVEAKPETCDGKDNDCDGQVDEGVKNTYYYDGDKDGYGATGSSLQACTPPAGYDADSGDCDDGNAFVHPGAAEVCDSADNDCDGSTNEGNVCKDCVTGKSSGKKLCLIGTFKLPDIYVQGIEWVPTTGHLWVAALSDVQGQSQLRKVTVDGQVVATYPYPASFAKDLAFDGEFLWSTAIFPGAIYKLNLSGASQGTWAMKNNELATGIAWMGSYFKIVALIALMQQDFHVWKYTGSTNFTNPIIGACPVGETCFFNGMTQRDGDLWHTTASGGIEQRTEDWSLLDGFLLQGVVMDAAPVGIAWDGSTFWVTEAGTGNVFRFIYF